MSVPTSAQRERFERAFREAVTAGRLRSTDRDEAYEVFSASAKTHDVIRHGAGLFLAQQVSDRRTPDPTKRTLHASRPGDVHGQPPPGLDDFGAALHSQVISKMRADRTLDYEQAFAAVFPDADAPPGAPTEELLGEAADEQRVAHNRAVAMARTDGISYMDALIAAEYENAVRELVDNDGASDVAWLDARKRQEPAKPWSEEDWEIDRRRAEAHGVDNEVNRAYWEQATYEGRDLVNELFEARRHAALERATTRLQNHIAEAQVNAAAERAAAINSELDRRARERIAKQDADEGRGPTVVFR